MVELVTIKKHGQPKLRIHPDALAQHLKLGWHEAADEPAPAKPDAKKGGKSDEKVNP